MTSQPEVATQHQPPTLLLLLIGAGVLPSAVYAFACVYGIANGLLTIAKATIPVELFGFANVGAVLGGFSAPSLVTRALAPFGFALVMDAAGTSEARFGLVVVGLAPSAWSVGAAASGCDCGRYSA